MAPVVAVSCAAVAAAQDAQPAAVSANSLYAGLTWHYNPAGFSVTAEAIGRAQIYVDDSKGDAAAGYWTGNVRCGFEQDSGHWHLTEYASVDNQADRRYVGSVIVNETNSRFFEPAPGGTALLMFTAAYREWPAAP